MPHQEVEITSKAQLEAFCKTNKVVLVDFHAVWCGPCKIIAPYVHQKCSAGNVALAKVDVDQNSDLAALFSITGMPTFKVLGSNLEVLDSIVGGGKANVDKMVQLAVSKKQT